MSEVTKPIDARQEMLDEFYHQNGPCCAGCDWWHSFNSRAGECHRTVMIPGADRGAPLGVTGSSLAIGAGHVMTRREHVCGEFKDKFDWSSLPLAYRKRVGDPTAASRFSQKETGDHDT